MSIHVASEKVELVKKLLKSIQESGDVSELRKRFKDVLTSVTPFEILTIEQQLVRDGVAIADILKLCDLHVELFREYLQPKVLKDVPEGHPLDLFVKENALILKASEALGVYASALSTAEGVEQMRGHLSELAHVLKELRKVRLHYRKVQMLVFPYLERRGIVAVPRVLWGREDRTLQTLRQVVELVERPEVVEALDVQQVRDVASRVADLAREFSELVFRENKILFPAIWALFSEGEWAAISKIADEMGWLVEAGGRWTPSVRPVLPYELEVRTTFEQIEGLSPEFKTLALSQEVEPDSYTVRSGNDLDLGTGFLSPEEIKELLKTLPLEITYSNADDRVKFFTESMLTKGFVRSPTIVGRKVEYCHPPRLEGFVKKNIELLKTGRVPYKEFWTRSGDRIIRVLIAPVRGEKGEFLGTVEIVEDMTEIINKTEEIKKRIVVL